MIIYFNGQFMLKNEVKVSPDDRGFLFADGAYEVIRAYHGNLFKIDRHIERMARSLRELRIKGPEHEIFKDVAEQLIQNNDLLDGEALVYLQVTRGAAPRRHAFPGSDTPPTVYAYASPFQPFPEKLTHGVRIILVPDIRWTRCDIKSVSLLPNVLAHQQAKENGVDEAIFIRDGAITEGTHTNFGAVFDGQLITYPKSHYILAGITREVVLNLCRELNIPIKEFPILVDDLKKADEAMLLSTTSEVTPVVQVDDWPVGNGKPGPITTTLQRAFRKLTGIPEK
ncbi:D-amino-acid transaminase [Chloroflexota bacterium]